MLRSECRLRKLGEGAGEKDPMRGEFPGELCRDLSGNMGELGTRAGSAGTGDISCSAGAVVGRGASFMDCTLLRFQNDAFLVRVFGSDSPTLFPFVALFCGQKIVDRLGVITGESFPLVVAEAPDSRRAELRTRLMTGLECKRSGLGAVDGLGKIGVETFGDVLVGFAAEGMT